MKRRLPKSKKAELVKSPKAKKARPLLTGEVLQDTLGKKWRLVSELAEGHMGPIYAATSDDAGSNVEDDVVKIEKKSSGHLFNEHVVYQGMGVAKLAKKWTKDRGLSHLGIPVPRGQGTHNHEGEVYRFLVLPRLGTDLDTLMGTEQMLAFKDVSEMAMALIDCLEFIHEHGYVHGDIHPANIIVDDRKGNSDKEKTVHLVDYGLARKYMVDGKHKPYEESKFIPDCPTLYMSTDGHRGTDQSRRGDLEMLGYCLLQWLCGRLPWEDKPQEKNYVRDSKIKFKEDITSNVHSDSLSWMDDSQARGVLMSYFDYVCGLDYEEKPNYGTSKKLLQELLTEPRKKETTAPLAKSKGSKVRYKNPEPLAAPDISKPTADVKTTRTSKAAGAGEPKEAQVDAQIKSPNLKSPKRASLTKETNPKIKGSISKSVVRSGGSGSDTGEKSKPFQKHGVKTRPNTRLTLNVGGTEFVTYSKTLEKYPSRLADIAHEAAEHQDIPFIDRDPTLFPYILNFLRDDGQTTLPETKQDLRKLRQEARYFSLTSLTDKIDRLVLE
ncbi:serine/threonine-protein kinase VRK1-like [Haliotis rubra]|uniref:serine/threonine-protein kinase VRK1-like n=1 Tax=Haliotis rubra TaxID=36100 RepID=UPI001EE5AC16|nr:serine/threonine-protein kinase VRK1-like [Haliotis rubra]XP_046567137.1 serine/threonine-protein kinase VRK1-like [Haliotis rubra]